MTTTIEKVTIEAGTLRAALADVLKAVPARAPRPILQNVRLGDGLITGTDLELRIDREIDYHGEPVLLPAARLFSIVRELPADATVSIEPDGTKCKIKAARGSWTLPTEAVLEYPAAEPGELQPVCRMPVEQFRRNVIACSYAAVNSKDAGSRPAMTAIRLEVADGNPTFVATDGRRLAIVQAETDQAVDNTAVNIPAHAAIAASAGDGDSVQVETDGKHVVFTSGGLTVCALMLHGQFPRWRDAVPVRPGVKRHTIQREELRRSVLQAAIVTSEQSKGVEFTFGKSLKLTAQSSEAGQASVTVGLEDAGDAGTVKLDPGFVVDFLRTLDGEADPTVTVEIGKPGDAVVLRCDDVTGVIMPLAE
jgi:DNA polymerase III subunit beta